MATNYPNKETLYIEGQDHEGNEDKLEEQIYELDMDHINDIDDKFSDPSHHLTIGQ